MNEKFLHDIKSICADVREGVPMSRYTTFRTGGAADIMATPKTAEEICAVIRLCRASSVPYTVVGNGSNLLVSDGGIEGVVIRVNGEMSEIRADGETITAEGGALLSQLARAAENSALSGLEFAAGIPGTVGGGVCMNAGAYGGELGDVITSVTYADENGDIKTAQRGELDFSYRHSMFSGRQCVVLECTLALKAGSRDDISARMNDYRQRRAEKQPLNMPSAGSTFKRPEGHFAGQLIEQAGLKGFTHGGAQVSEKHAGFIVNKGGATAADIEELIELVRKKVFDGSGVMLEPEVKIIGRRV